MVSVPGQTETQRVAAVIRDAVVRGDYAPGAYLPHGADLAAQLGAGKYTVYAAFRLLAAEGLLDVIRGTGTRVRETADVTVMVRGRTVLHDALGYYFDPGAKHWQSPPDRPTRVSWQEPPADVAAILGTGAEPVLRRYRLVGPPGGPVAQLAISHIQPETARTLDLGGASTGPGGIYARMEDAGYSLGWTERVTARMPSPGESADLAVPRGVPALRILRTTEATRDHARHVAEVTEILMRADRYAVGYRLHR